MSTLFLRDTPERGIRRATEGTFPYPIARTVMRIMIWQKERKACSSVRTADMRRQNGLASVRRAESGIHL